MLLIGLVFFCFLLVLFWSGIVWIVGKIGQAKGQEQKYRKYTTYLGVFIAVATILFLVADEIYTKKQFEQLCKKEAGLKIYKTVDNVDGFLTKNISLHEPDMFNYGYVFIESYDYEKKQQINREYLENNSIVKEKNIVPKSKYIVFEKENNISTGLSKQKDIDFYHAEIKEINSNHLLAEKKTFAYRGGKFVQSLSRAYSMQSTLCGHVFNSDFIKQVLQPTVQKEINNE